jgi:hypothetical protein
VITSERARRIAAMTAALSSERGSIGARSSRRPALTRALRFAGQLEVSSGVGPAFAAERLALDSLVSSGRITRTEADEYLADRYPAQRYSGGRFADRALAEAQAAAAEAQALGSPDAQAMVDRAREAGKRDPLNGSDEAALLRVSRLPEEYDARAVERAVRGLAEDVSSQLRALRTTPPRLPAHSLNGGALAPGTVPPEALDMPRAGTELVSWPTEDEAIDVRYAQSTALDRYVVRSSVSGPGRIWEALETRPGPRARVGLGAARYRLIRTGTRFGVMSCRLPLTADMAANPTPGILFQYGIIVRGIPSYLGRAPRRILAAQAVGESPVSFRRITRLGGGTGWATGGTNRNFYWTRTQAEHVTATFPFMDVFGTDATLLPADTFVRMIGGFSFQLITGRTGGEVFRQLCSRQILGRSLVADGHAPAVTIPEGLPIEAPTCPSCVDWQSISTYTHRTEGYDLTTAGTRIVNGMPFSYSDCEALAATDDRFSVVILPVGEMPISQSGLASLSTPEEWHRNGLQMGTAGSSLLREWAVDIIVD